MSSETPPGIVSEAEAAFLSRRKGFVQWWPTVSLGLLLLLSGLFVGLFLKASLLVRPAQIWTRLQSGTLESSTLALLAGMLPVVLLGWLATLAVVILFASAARSNDRKYIAIIERLLRFRDSASGIR